MLEKVTTGEKALNIDSITYNGLTWVNIQAPTREEINRLGQIYPFFHPFDLDDTLSRIQVPKLDEYIDYLFVVLHFPVFDKKMRVSYPSQVSVFLGPDYLVTIHQGDLKPLVEMFKDCKLVEKTREENFRRGSAFLLYRVVDRLVDYCFPMMNKVMDNLDKVEDLVYDVSRPEAVVQLSIVRRDITHFRRIVLHTREAIAALKQKLGRFSKENMEVYMGDVVDHMDKLWHTLDGAKEVVEGFDDTNNSLSAYRMSEIIRVLTVFVTILTGILVIPSIYGMNIRLPGGLAKEGDLITFGVVSGLTLAFIGGTLFFFRLKKWI